MPRPPRRPHRRSALLALVVAVLAVGLAAAPGSTASGTRTASAAGDSVYGDPCEATTGVDLRSIALGPLLADDGRASAAPVAVDVGLCAPAPSGALALRLDLHRLRADGADHLETPSGWVRLHGDGGSYRAETVVGGVVRATSPVETRPSARRITGLTTSVDACLLVEAAGGRCASDRSVTGLPTSSLPPLAIRACTADGDCGPGWRAERDAAVADPSAPAPGVDYLPEPAHLPLTYPSMCQQGAAARVASRTGVRTSAARTTAGRPADPWYAGDGPGAPTGQWNLERVGAPSAWDVTTGDAATTVALIDSGIDGRHPDLRGVATAVVDVVPGRDGVVVRPLDPQADSDVEGHGTAVASVLAARTDTTGITGIAPRVSLLVARVLDAEGCAADAAIATALRWAADAGADVITMSLGGPQPAPELDHLGQRLHERGVVLVAAAGNGGGRHLEYPAAYDPFLSVSATGFAAAGDPVEDPPVAYASVNPAVDLAAPGGTAADARSGVLVACWRGPDLGHGWCRDAGTSFAAPLAAGAAALVRTLDPARTADGVRDTLLDTAHDLTEGADRRPGPDPSSGAGLLRLDRALGNVATRGGQLLALGATASPVDAAVAASRHAHADASAAHAVVARADVLADALAGAPLAGSSGPLLLTPPGQLPDRVVSELGRVLPRGRTVYLLGGTGALPQSVAERLSAEGWRPVRVAGASRTETALAAARALRAPRGSEVVLASATSWADAVAAGVRTARTGTPLLLVGGDGVEPLLDYLDELAPSRVTVVGGEAVVPSEVTTTLRRHFGDRVRRVAGASRYQTAAALAALDATAAPRHVLGVGGDGPHAAAYGLAAVTLGGALDAPLLLVDDRAAAPALRHVLHDRWGLRPGGSAATAVTLGPLATDGSLEGVTRQRLLELVGG